MQNTVRFACSASSGCEERHNGFSRKIVAFKERFYDSRRNIPPYGKADKNDAVFLHILDSPRNGGTAALVIHFARAAAVFVHPVDVRCRIRLRGLDFKQIGACRLREHIGCTGSYPRCKKNMQLTFWCFSYSFSSLFRGIIEDFFQAHTPAAHSASLLS